MYCNLSKFQTYNTISSTVLLKLHRKPLAQWPYHSDSWHSVTGITSAWIHFLSTTYQRMWQHAQSIYIKLCILWMQCMNTSDHILDSRELISQNGNQKLKDNIITETDKFILGANLPDTEYCKWKITSFYASIQHSPAPLHNFEENKCIKCNWNGQLSKISVSCSVLIKSAGEIPVLSQI